MSRARAFAFALLSIVGPGCTVILGSEVRQCVSDDDCPHQVPELACVDNFCLEAETSGSDTGTEPSPTGPWACLATEPGEREQADDVDLYYNMEFVDAVSREPLPGLMVRLCNAFDVKCADPLATDLTPNDSNLVTVTVPYGFHGYLEVTSQTTFPLIYWLVTPVQYDIDVTVPIPSFFAFEVLVSTVGEEVDPTRGHMIAVALNCEWNFASGVRFTLDSSGGDASQFYLYNSLPKLDADVTSEEGVGGFLNVPPGFVSVSATLHETGALIEQRSVIVRASWITSLLAPPAQALPSQ